MLRRLRISVRGLMAAVLACGLLAWLADRATTPVRDRRLQDACRANLRAIGVALHAYHAAWGSFPPAYAVDRRGRPTLSWRVLILPYVGQRALHDAFHLDEPWDGPRNRALIARMPPLYACPAHEEAAAEGRTAYQALVGPHTLFPGARPVALSQVVAEPETFAVIEVLNGEAPWSAPRDVEIEKLDVTLKDHRRSLAYPPRGGAVGRHHLGSERKFEDGHRLDQFGANVLTVGGRVGRSGVTLGASVLTVRSTIDTVTFTSGQP